MILAILDFHTNTIEKVIGRVLEMDRAQNGNYMVMGGCQERICDSGKQYSARCGMYNEDPMYVVSLPITYHGL